MRNLREDDKVKPSHCREPLITSEQRYLLNECARSDRRRGRVEPVNHFRDGEHKGEPIKTDGFIHLGNAGGRGGLNEREREREERKGGGRNKWWDPGSVPLSSTHSSAVHIWSSVVPSFTIHEWLERYANNGFNFILVCGTTQCISEDPWIHCTHTHTIHPDSCLFLWKTIRPPVKARCPAEARRGEKFFPYVRGGHACHSFIHLQVLFSLNALYFSSSNFKQIIDRVVYPFQTHQRGRTLRDYENK